MKIPVHIAEKLLLLAQGEVLPSGSVKHSVIEDLIAEGILERKGRIKKTLQLHNIVSLNTYLQNCFSISNLNLYIEAGKKENISRSELVAVSSNSKLRRVRTFKGFLVNCYEPMQVILNSEEITLRPPEGSFQFIYDFETFAPPPLATIVGIENPENFRYIDQQKKLFSHIQPLFVSRYPQTQSKDLIKWLQQIPNHYLHFGDFDFAGIGIFLNEFKKHLSEKAQFFIPKNIEELLMNYGSRERYNTQKINFQISSIKEPNLPQLIKLLHKYKKGLDQELLIGLEGK
jgi:hypothetical protein